MDHSAETARHRAREAHLNGAGRGAGRPRPDVAASWSRVAASGVDPGGGPAISPLTGAEIEHRRTSSGLDRFVPMLARSLQTVLDAGQMMVVSDADGRVLWRRGSPAVRRMADRLGFIPGSAWTEGNVGTNAIGTALVLGQPVQIQGAEHFVEAHTRWGCAAAPLADPWTGRLLGVVDVSGPSSALHPAELAAVDLAARLTSMELAQERRRELDRLRTRFAPLLARIDGPALVVDRDGHVALSSGREISGADTVALPDDLQPGRVWLPSWGWGAAVAEPLAGGWLLRDAGEAQRPNRIVIDLAGSPVLRVSSEVGDWSHRLTRRHAELMFALARRGAAGARAADLADDLFADRSRVVTIRAELSRLRKSLGPIVLTQPYRITPEVSVEVVLPPTGSVLLPGSSAPVVHAARRGH